VPTTFTDEQRALLDLPNTFARVASLMPTGAPQNTTIWYRRDGDTLVIATGAKAQKTRNVARDPRVAVIVEHPANPYHYVQVRGRAAVVYDTPRAIAEFRLIAPRYIGAKAGAWVDAIAASGGFDGAVTVVHPERVSAFVDVEPG
jgi:PPOX class probable F420-dependent enzyme